MKSIVRHLAITLMPLFLTAQNIHINPDTSLFLDASSSIYAFDKNIVNDGVMDLNGTLAIGGANSADITMQNNNAMDIAILQVQDVNEVALSGPFNIQHINFINDVPIILGSGSSIELTGSIINESHGRHITGESGTYVHTQRDAGTTEAFGNIGVNIISADSPLGITDVYRRFTAIDIDGNASINRYYEVSPVNNSGLNATARFQFFDADLSGETFSELVLYKSEDGISTWSQEGGTPFATSTSNYIELSNIDSFSTWAIAEEGITLSTDNPELESAIGLYPNPVSNMLNITKPNHVSIQRAMLTDIIGKTIPIDVSSNNSIDMFNFSEGMYMLTLITSEGVYSKKLIVKH